MTRTITASAFVVSVLLGTLSAAQNPPWRILYDNDATNLLNCPSPFNADEPDVSKRVLTDEKIRASVREAAVDGVDAQLLQPCTSWVPWWKSDIVPLRAHEEWFRAHYGVEPNVPEQRYLLAGGDIVRTFADECHRLGRAALVSFRMNDAHHQERSFDDSPPAVLAHCINRFYVEHPEYRLAPPPSRAAKDRVHNWLIPEARAHKERLLAELIANYPQLDGVELDFLRHPYYFPDGTPAETRRAVMRGVIRNARAALDAVAEKTDGKHRYLGVRIPALQSEWNAIGLEPKSWRAEGVDYFNVSPSYNTTQQTDIAALRRAVPDAKIYAELTHTAQTWKFGGPGYDDHCFRRCTREMLESTSRIAYARGADGISLYNFAYYRPHGGLRARRGPFNEPPFSYLPTLANAASLKKSAGYFFLWVKDELFPSAGAPRTYSMDIVPAKGNGSARLRLWVLSDEEKRFSEVESPQALERGKWEVALNAKTLAQVENTHDAYPFPTEFAAGFGRREQYVAFDIPAQSLKDGINTITVRNLSSPQPLRVRWIEILQPTR